MKIPSIVILLVLLLAACQPAAGTVPTAKATGDAPPEETRSVPPAASPTPTRQPTPTTHPSLQVPLAELNGLRLLFWHPWTGAAAQAVEAVVREFNETNLWGILVFTNPAGGASTLVHRVENSQAGDPLPHILTAPAEQVLLWQDELDLFTDLTPYLQDPTWGLTGEERASIPASYWDQAASAGAQVGVPVLQDLRVLFYNRSWGQELGFSTPPNTWDAFAKQACAAAAVRKDVDLTGGYIVDTHPLTALGWILAADPPPVYDPDQDLYQFDSQAAGSALADLRKLFDDGCAWNSRLPDPYAYFADRQALFFTGSLADIAVQSQWMASRSSLDDWAVLPFPSDEDKPVVPLNGSAISVLSASPQEQLASWLFVRWLILPRNLAQLAEASGLLPASAAAAGLMTSYRQNYPQWEAALSLAPLARLVPSGGSWVIAQSILEDAAWQTFQPSIKPEEIPLILEQVDQLIPEVLAQRKK